MANLMTIKLNKNAGASWGFRLQGGKDFATPLCIQKVNGGSVAEHAGLQAGDSIVSINGHDALALRHKEAQDTIMKAGNNFDLVIQRGSCIWRPNVTALPEKTTLPDGIPVATKTSLAANQKPVRYVGSNHNCLPRPFPGAFNNDVPSATLKTVSAPTSKVQNGQSHSSPAYDKATVTNGFHSTPEPFSNAGKDGCESKNSSTSFPHFGIDEATSVLTISGTDVSLDKENARNFLMMTLDKENVNTLNLLQNSSKLPQTIPKTNGSSFRSHSIHNLQPTFSGTSRSASSSSVGSTHDLLGRGFRKHSFGSNCSSVSSASSHDGDSESSNHSQKDAPRPIGSGHNTVAAPFGEGKLVNVQYNTPLNLYSEDSIAETLSAQAEVLDKGVLGVNFMKNDKSYDGRASDVLRMVQEMDNEPQCETPGTPTNILGTLDRPVVHGYSFKLLQRALDDEVTPPTQGFPSGQIAHGGPGGEHHAGENICSACQRLIVGVFVRIKNKNLHAECFKCSTCGSSLKNVGYYNISDKLYCDIHAKQAARTHPPAPNLEPVTIQPGAAPPPGAISLPQASKMKIPVAFQHDKEHAPAPVLAPDPAPAPVPFKSPLGGIRLTPTSPSALNTPTPYKPEPEVPEPVPQEIPEPAPEPVTEPIFVPEPELEVAPQPQVAPLHVDEVVEAPPILPPIEMEGPPQEETLPPLQEPCESPIEEIKVETEYKPVENGFVEEAPMPEPVLQPVQEREPIVESPKCNAEEVAKVDFEAEGAVEPEEPTKELPITNQVEEPLLSPPEEGVWGIEKPASFEPEQNHFPVEDVPEPALPEAVPEVKESEFKLEPTFAFEPKMPDLEAIFKPVAPEAIFKPVAPEAIFKLEEPAAVTEPLFEPKGTLFGTEGVSNSFSQFHSEESRFVETRYSSSSSVVQKSFVGDAAFERSPVPAPAPHKPFAPAPAPAPAPVAAAPMKPAPAPAFHSAANPQGFGAPAGDVNVRSHIPRKGTVNAASSQGSETPTCHVCHAEMRGPFVSALGKTWCPDHFVCATSTCKKNLIDMGFVEEQGELYCEHCYESYLAPICGKCDKRVKGDCLNAVGKQFHPECFCCAYCGKVFGSGAFYLEDGLPYCETDWNELFTTKCVGCNFPIEAGDRWVEALNNNYHSQCFKCSKCHKNLEGQSFFAKGGKPFCKIHAQRGF